MEPVFRTLELTAITIARLQGGRRRYFGLDHVPANGGAVIAVNHTAYSDFLPLALGVYRAGRRARFMIKSEVMEFAIMRFLVHQTRAVPVDRSAGADAYTAAVQQLRDGDLVIVYPESTISRSFELKEFKHGAVRMAAEAGVPIVPAIVWGAQRQWTKGAKRRIGPHRIPIDTAFGEPVSVRGDDVAADTARLRDVMQNLLDEVQGGYPDRTVGADWLPARLGGSAPTPQEALVIEEAEAQEKARRRAEKAKP